MKLVKSQIILFLFEDLKEGKRVNSLSFCNDHNISQVTFKRYIAEIRAYLVNAYQNIDIIYIKSENVYCINDITENISV